MKQVPAIDKQFETKVATDPGAVIHGYREARKKDLDLMVLSDRGLFADTVPAVVDSLRKYGIEQVALTVTSTALMDILWAFTEAGATFEMKQVDTGAAGFYGNDKRFIPGFVITLN